MRRYEPAPLNASPAIGESPATSREVTGPSSRYALALRLGLLDDLDQLQPLVLPQPSHT